MQGITQSVTLSARAHLLACNILEIFNIAYLSLSDIPLSLSDLEEYLLFVHFNGKDICFLGIFLFYLLLFGGESCRLLLADPRPVLSTRRWVLFLVVLSICIFPAFSILAFNVCTLKVGIFYGSGHSFGLLLLRSIVRGNLLLCITERGVSGHCVCVCVCMWMGTQISSG